MKATEKPTFDTKDWERIYEYVETNGAERPEKLYTKNLVRIDPERCKQLIAIMTRDGYLVEEDGLLRVDWIWTTKPKKNTRKKSTTSRSGRPDRRTFRAS